MWPMARTAARRQTSGMAEPAPQPYQLASFPALDKPFNTPGEAARAALQALLIHSTATRNEYGGMICRLRGKYYVMPYVEGERNSVSVGQDAPDKGCPIEGAVPVAYYHTHPNVAGAGFTMKPDEMSPEDEAVARGARIDAYMGSISGLYLKFNHKTGKTYVAGPRLINSEPPSPPPAKKPQTRQKGLPPKTIKVAPPL